MSAFVRAHTTAQELLQQHLSQLHNQGPSSNQAAGPAAHAAGDSSRLDQVVSNNAHKTSTVKSPLEVTEEAGLPNGRPGSLAAGVVDDVGGDPTDDVQALHTVLPESQQEVSAASDYVQQVLWLSF